MQYKWGAYIIIIIKQNTKKAFRPQANYTDQPTADAGEASADFCE
jgi:hypothetical protein